MGDGGWPAAFLIPAPRDVLGRLSDLSNPANSFYHLDQFSLTSLRVFQYTQVSHHDLLSNSKTFYSNRPKSDRLLVRFFYFECVCCPISVGVKRLWEIFGRIFEKPS